MGSDVTPERPQEEGELSFEALLDRLQRVVEQLEQGDTPLEEALAAYEQGVRLSRLAARRLDEAERRIELLMSENEDGVQTRLLESAPERSLEKESDAR
jgi:exodeoxyribonuclease VII small subunit